MDMGMQHPTRYLNVDVSGHVGQVNSKVSTLNFKKANFKLIK